MNNSSELLATKYDALLAATARTEADTLALVGCAVLLVEASVFSGKSSRINVAR